jgi:hypothetical protein
MKDEIRQYFENEATYELFKNFVDAHHDGNLDAGVRDLLFCHKFVWAYMHKKAIEEMKQR